MSIPPDIFAGLKPIVGDWPDLGANALPQSERPAANEIQQSLHALSGYTDDFGATLRLFDESLHAYALATVTKTTNDGQARMHIAARDGAMTIFNFARTVEGIHGKNAFTNCPTLSTYVDREQLRSARKLLNQSFPDFVPIRHSVAHAAELREETEKHHAEAVVGDIFPTLRGTPLANIRTKMMLRGALQDRNFICTFEGKVRTYEVSANTFSALKKIKEQVFAAFARSPATYQP